MATSINPRMNRKPSRNADPVEISNEIYVDNQEQTNIENRNPRTQLAINRGPSKRMDNKAQPQRPKRQPLELITSNNSRGRPQQKAIKSDLSEDFLCSKVTNVSSKASTKLPVVAKKAQEESSSVYEDGKENAVLDTAKATKVQPKYFELQALELSDKILDDLLSSPMSLVESGKEDAKEEEPSDDETSPFSGDMMEFSTDIYLHLRKIEVQLGAKPYYMRRQPDITYHMRSILVDWLVEVTDEYKLQTDTLYLAVAYVDKFLSCMSVMRNKLQLVGTTSMFIASKYEEIYPPDVKEFVYITDDTYTKKQVLQMEQLMLKVLSFDLAIPTAYTFLQFIAKLMSIEGKTYHLALYLCELTLLEGDPYLQFAPSMIACAAICIANRTLGNEVWDEKLGLHLGYTFEQLRNCVGFLYRTYLNATTFPQQAIRDKYKSEEFNAVSLIVPSLTW